MQDEEEKKIRMVTVYATIPFVLAIPPIMGWMIGSWLDNHLATSPFLMYFLLVLGFVAGGRECYRIISKYGNGPGSF